LPNTLCHIGIQAPLSRIAFGKDQLLWVVIACILPDVPWIVQKCCLSLGLFDPYDLRLYCIAQASLFFCLFLCGALACCTRPTGKIFLILSGNCLFHLLLDAVEIKWGNGVHIAAPVSWKMLHLDQFWPDHPLVIGFTAAGFVYLLFSWRHLVASRIQLQVPGKIKTSVGVLLFACYMLGPLFFLQQLEQTDTNYIHTLREKDQRPGKTIEFDRVSYFAEQQTLQTFSGERIIVTGSQPTTSGRVSFSGHFLTPTSFVSVGHKYHRDQRDLASLVGLFMACTLLLQSLILPHFQAPKKQGPS
jgi:hypothetical protein